MVGGTQKGTKHRCVPKKPRLDKMNIREKRKNPQLVIFGFDALCVYNGEPKDVPTSQKRTKMLTFDQVGFRT